MKLRILTYVIGALCISAGTAESRTWTASNGQVLEAEFVEHAGGRVVLKNARGQIYRISPASLSSADREYLRSLEDQPANTGGEGGGLPTLEAPVSVEGSDVSGEGDQREAILKITNNGKRGISGMTIETYYIKNDGTLDKSVPHSQSGFTGNSGNVLKRNKTHEMRIDHFFMTDDTVRIEGAVTKIIYENRKTWPELPDEIPAQNGNDPVSAVFMGVTGKGIYAKPACAYFNHDRLAVRDIYVTLEYLDASGKVVGHSNYGHSTGSGGIRENEGTVITFGQPPPEDTADVRVIVKEVTYIDNTKWKADAKGQ